MCPLGLYMVSYYGSGYYYYLSHCYGGCYFCCLSVCLSLLDAFPPKLLNEFGKNFA